MSATNDPDYVRRRNDRQHKEQERDRSERDAQERQNNTTALNSLVEEVRGYRAEENTYEPKKISTDRIAAIAAVIAAILSLGSLIAFVFLTLKTDRTAENALAITRQALLGVERPVLLADIFYADPFPKVGGPSFGFSIENTGKQIAKLLAANAIFKIQRSSNIPRFPPISSGGDNCAIFFVGELPVRVNRTIGLRCYRKTALTSEEANSFATRKSLGFLDLLIMYSDPVGVLRELNTVFVVISPLNSSDCPAIIPVLSKDDVLRNASFLDTERQFESGELDIARRMPNRTTMPHQDQDPIGNVIPKAANCPDRYVDASKQQP